MVSRFFSKQSFHRRGSQVPVVITENSVIGDFNTLVKVAANHLGFSPNLQSTYSVSYIATVTEKGEEIARLGSPLHQMINKVSEYASRRSTVLADDIRKMDKHYGGSFLREAVRKEYLELRASKGNSKNQKFDYYVIRKRLKGHDKLQATMQNVVRGKGMCTLEDIKKIKGMDWVSIE
ncbi:hypothetical protein L5515_011354 [Caenorhabditis briggsae]|uniref:Uncharacterized protein n=1 Tax=Caenorhabditis briggsae TaxID=6238 RepID=A0AAE9EPK7_CAEBR|nr:hypothetical protein L5515_011354 [Caenorhabditis briggsae]